MTLLDRLARAIGALNDVGTVEYCECVKCVGMYQRQAQAALRVVCDALREPSEGMIDAVYLEAVKPGTMPADILRALAAHLEQCAADHLEGKDEKIMNSGMLYSGS